MFGIGGTELAIIAVFAFIIFGPDKVPELARTVGKFWRMFKSAQEDMERVIKAEVFTQNTGIEVPAEGAAPTVAEEVQKATAASTIWASAEADDEEEDEE